MDGFLWKQAPEEKFSLHALTCFVCFQTTLLMLFFFNAIKDLWCWKEYTYPFFKYSFLPSRHLLQSLLQLMWKTNKTVLQFISCYALFHSKSYLKGSVFTYSWLLCFFFFFLPHLEGWLFSPRALSFVSQPTYSAEDTGPTGLGSYCSKGKSPPWNSSP